MPIRDPNEVPRGRRLRKGGGHRREAAPPSGAPYPLIFDHSQQLSAAAPARRAKRRRRSRQPGDSALQALVRRITAWRERRMRYAAPLTGAARVAHWAAWIYLGAVVLFALLMWGLGDRWWPATVLLFMGRWVILLPLVLLGPAALFLRRTLLLPLAGAALIALGPVMGWRAGLGGAAPENGDLPFRVVTYNADGDLGGRVIAFILPHLLAELDADLVAFQECGELLPRELDSMEGWHSHVAGGLCLLSRHPITGVEVMDRSSLQEIRADARAIGGAGYVARYSLQTPRGPIAVTNLHLETARKGFEGLMQGRPDALVLNTALRDAESGLARRWAGSTTAPLLVLGDFNTPVESRIYREHWGDLRNAFSVAGRGFGITRQNGWIRIRIDHILVGPGWAVRSARVGEDLGSDHRPVIADLVLRSASP